MVNAKAQTNRAALRNVCGEIRRNKTMVGWMSISTGILPVATGATAKGIVHEIFAETVTGFRPQFGGL
jgi:hypothetical protein